METSKISFRTLSEIVVKCKKDIDLIIGEVFVNYKSASEINQEKFSRFLKQTFMPQFLKKWNKSHRTSSRFYSDNEEWLTHSYTLTDEVVDDTVDDEEQTQSTPGKRGRPTKTFEESNERTKKKKLTTFCEDNSEDIILSAAKKIGDKNEVQKCFSPEKALSLIVDASLTIHQYEILRRSAKDIGCNIYPSYKKVLAAKKTCYPANVIVEENLSKVSLQELLDHTAVRLMKSKSENEVASFPKYMQLISKWGCDGSSGHSEYHQNFANETFSDKSLFLTSLVPLVMTERNDESKVLWKNLEPSSTKHCRPLKFEFVKETASVINEEVNRVNKEINNLTNSIIEVHNKKFFITHKLSLTMIDGKIATTLTGSSSMSVCFICGAKPREMHNLDELAIRANSGEALKFGISPLHARIKFMECILHIAYNKSFAAWRTNKDTREIKEEAKATIQKTLN